MNSQEQETDWQTIRAALAAHFAPESVKWRIGSMSKDKTRATLLAYLDARDVQDRLDAVLGCDGWSFD